MSSLNLLLQLHRWTSTLAACLICIGTGPGCGGIEPQSYEQAIINGGQDNTHKTAVGIIEVPTVNWCSATLIGPTTVLTAGTCVTNLNNQVATQIYFHPGNQISKKIQVASAVLHPQYNANNLFNGSNIAVVRLSEPVAGATPLTISTTAPKVGDSVQVLGFGLSSVNDPKSSGVLRTGSVTITQISPNTFKFKAQNNSAPALCYGDLGGPALTQSNGGETVVGIHLGTTGQNCTGDMVDLRLDALRSWINNQSSVSGGSTGTGSTGTSSNDKTPPQVRILSPTPNQQLPTSFQVMIDAQDDTGISTVELYINGQVFDVRNTAPFNFQISNAPAGAFTIWAGAVDQANNRSLSQPVPIIIGGPTSSPYPQGFDPAVDPNAGQTGCSVSPAGAAPPAAAPLLLLLLALLGLGRGRGWHR
jgi:MYXO-CTERM domain-containing protein